MADEPTGNLDQANAQHIIQLFRRLADQEKISIIMVTHLREHADIADRVLLMQSGKLSEECATEVVQS